MTHRVTIVTMGPPPAEKSLKECISLGADKAVLVTDRKFAGADTLATSYVVARTIRKVEELWGKADIVFCGKQTLDGDTGQVGPGIACRLDLEQLTYVGKVVDVNPRQPESNRSPLFGGRGLRSSSLPCHCLLPRLRS